MSLRSRVTGALGASVSRDWSGGGGGGDEYDDMVTLGLNSQQDLRIEQQNETNRFGEWMKRNDGRPQRVKEESTGTEAAKIKRGCDARGRK